MNKDGTSDDRKRGWLAPRAALFFSIATVAAAADLLSKHWVFRHFFTPTEHGQDVHWWIVGILGIQTSTNPGALFGMGQGYSLWFAAASVVFFLFILVWLFVLGA
ncbi:MAG TPA: signal peptidase II, partial [Pirellulaceae bacterium]|nr:signal peptidase II [Pirellulaceae bacterium]